LHLLGISLEYDILAHVAGYSTFQQVYITRLLKPNSIFTSQYDNDRTKFITKFIGKHVFFDMTFYHPFPILGMVVSEHGAAEICVAVTGNVEKT